MQTTNKAKKVLVLSHDIAGNRMAGPGIRYVSIARELSRHFDTTLGLLDGTNQQIDELSAYGLKVRAYSENDYQALVDETEYIFGQHLSLEMLHYARSLGKRIIFDLYAPVPVEFLLFRYFSSTGFSSLERTEFSNLVATYRQYAKLGDYFICSNERQRDLWLGFMLANNILEDKQEVFTDINKLIGLAPMGISQDKPEHKQNVLRGVVPDIEKDDFILLWTGGLWDWFDPLKVVKAVEQARQDNPKIKLVFMGLRHPNKKIPYMREAKRTVEYVRQQGLEGQSVFFLDKWLPYDERVNYLLEADAAIYVHKDSLETRYSHRSRVLDHIYAGLPTIATGGDYLSDEVIPKHSLGLVAENSVEGLAEAIRKLSQDQSLRQNMRADIYAYGQNLAWDKTINPIVSYIKSRTPKSSLRPAEKQNPDSAPTISKLAILAKRATRKLKRYMRLI